MTTIAILLAVAVFIQSTVLRWIWLDREQMRLERKVFFTTLATEVFPKNPELAEFLVGKLEEARDFAIKNRGKIV